MASLQQPRAVTAGKALLNPRLEHTRCRQAGYSVVKTPGLGSKEKEMLLASNVVRTRAGV